MAEHLRTHGFNGDRCDECCNGDRCDDRTHFYRPNCPHCKGTGCALWTVKGRDLYAAQRLARGATNGQVLAELAAHGYGVPEVPAKDWLDEAMKLAEDYARAWQHDVDGSYVVKDQAPKAKDKLREHLAGVRVPGESQQ